jgi:hypothetical protein
VEEHVVVVLAKEHAEKAHAEKAHAVKEHAEKDAKHSNQDTKLIVNS